MLVDADAISFSTHNQDICAAAPLTGPVAQTVTDCMYAGLDAFQLLAGVVGQGLVCQMRADGAASIRGSPLR